MSVTLAIQPGSLSTGLFAAANLAALEKFHRVDVRNGKVDRRLGAVRSREL